MLKKAPFLLIIPVLLACVETASAQKFLGPRYSDEMKFSPKHGIPYWDGGYNEPKKHKWKVAMERGAPDSVLEDIKNFPGSPDAIGEWVDDAWDEAVAAFSKCGGSLADFASRLSPFTLSGGVEVVPTIWFEPALNSYLAGGYYPVTRSVKVVNLYYGTTGNYRHARELLKWEIKNHFGTMAGINSEPFASDWPCRAR